VLIASYPIAGLESLARFAERAGVSPPTVTRFIAKLGFRGYPEFQDVLRSEVQSRLSSPLARYDRDPPSGDRSGAVIDALRATRDMLAATEGLLSEQEFEDVAARLARTEGRVLVLGGRLSAMLARHLAGQLHLLRPGVLLLDAERSTPAQQLIDLSRRDVLVVFDYRRYQADTVASARIAAAKKCAVVLFTDPWLSPISGFADQVLVTGVESGAAFDSLVAALAVVEALVAAVLGKLGTRAHARMEKLEELRAGSVWGEELAAASKGRVRAGDRVR
jgi:DNA-binding MurR/RpiR family transcriptional regulator